MGGVLPGDQAATAQIALATFLSQHPLSELTALLRGSSILIWKGNEDSCNFVGSRRPSLRHFRADWQWASRVEPVTQETDWELSPAAPVGVSNHGWSPKCFSGPTQAG